MQNIQSPLCWCPGPALPDQGPVAAHWQSPGPTGSPSRPGNLNPPPGPALGVRTRVSPITLSGSAGKSGRSALIVCHHSSHYAITRSTNANGYGPRSKLGRYWADRADYGNRSGHATASTPTSCNRYRHQWAFEDVFLNDISCTEYRWAKLWYKPSYTETRQSYWTQVHSVSGSFQGAVSY